MAEHARIAPLVWGVPAGIGLLVAALLGVYEPGWGVALSFPAATVVIAFGTWRERRDQVLPMTLRAILGATVGFGLCTIAVTSVALADPRVDPAVAAELREALLIRWVVMFSCLPVGVGALVFRRRLERRREPT